MDIRFIFDFIGLAGLIGCAIFTSRGERRDNAAADRQDGLVARRTSNRTADRQSPTDRGKGTT